MDLQSLEGTCVNGEHLAPHAPSRALVSGDLITFGVSSGGVRLTGRRRFTIKCHTMNWDVEEQDAHGSCEEYFEEIGGDADKPVARKAIDDWKKSPFKFVSPGDKQGEGATADWDFVLRRASLFLNKITTYCLDNPPPLPDLPTYVSGIMEDIIHLRWVDLVYFIYSD